MLPLMIYVADYQHNSSGEEPMNENAEQLRMNRSGKVLGIVLISVGIVFFVGQTLRIDLGAIAWPFFVSVPGVILFLASLAADERAGEPLAMLGTAATVVGVILFYQNVTGHWASWAYAWALVAPTAFGVGQWLHGTLRHRPDKVESGLRVAGVGIVMFLIGAAFFELVIGLSGLETGRWGWPIALIAFGVILLTRGLIGPRRKA